MSVGQRTLETFIETRFINYQLEESSNGITLIKGKYQQADEVNENGRDYSQPVWDHIFRQSDTMQRIKGRGMIGELEHPADGQTKLDRGSHIVTNLWQDESTGAILGESEVVPTPKGLILEVYVKRNVLFGVSSRGKGTSTHRNGIEYVDPGFMLETFDFVYNPSTRGAYPKGFQKTIESQPDFDFSKYNTKGEDLNYINELVPLLVESSQIIHEISRGNFVESNVFRRLLDIEKQVSLIEKKDSELSKVCNSIFGLVLEAKNQMGVQQNNAGNSTTSVIPDQMFDKLTNSFSMGFQEGIKAAKNLNTPITEDKEDKNKKQKNESTNKPKKTKKQESKELDSLPEMDNEDDYSRMEMGNDHSHGNGTMPKPGGKVNNEKNYSAKHQDMVKQEMDHLDANGKKVYGEMGDDHYEDDDIDLGADDDSIHGEMDGDDYAHESEEEPEGSLGVNKNDTNVPKRDPVLTMALTGESVNGQKVESLSKKGLLKLVENLANKYESSVKLNEALLVKCRSLKESNKTLCLHYENSVGLLSGVVERVEEEKKQAVISEAIKNDPGIEYLRPVLEDCNDVQAIKNCIAESKKIAKEDEKKQKTESKKTAAKKRKRKKDNNIFDESISNNKKEIANQKKKPKDIQPKTESQNTGKDKKEAKVEMALVESISGKHGWK